MPGTGSVILAVAEPRAEMTHQRSPASEGIAGSVGPSMLFVVWEQPRRPTLGQNNEVDAKCSTVASLLLPFFTSGSLERACEWGISTAIAVHLMLYTNPRLHLFGKFVLQDFYGPLVLKVNFKNRDS